MKIPINRCVRTQYVIKMLVNISQLQNKIESESLSSACIAKFIHETSVGNNANGKRGSMD